MSEAYEIFLDHVLVTKDVGDLVLYNYAYNYVLFTLSTLCAKHIFYTLSLYNPKCQYNESNVVKI
jgi:hypothetical protein